MSMPGEELVDDGTDADFDSGFAPISTGKKPPEDSDGKAAAASTSETTAGDGKGEAGAGAETTQAAPEYVQLTKTELEELRAAAAKTAGYDQQFARINGTLGNIRQNIAKPAAEATAGQQPVKEGAEVKTPSTDANVDVISDSIRNHEVGVLAAEYPNWREIVGAPDKDGNVNKDHPYRVWLAAQPAAYQAKINDSNSALIIMRSIEKFNEDTAKAAATKANVKSPQAEARRTVIKNAIQPRGDGGQPPPAKTEDDYFNEGFRTG
jgi:hypothetical protein